MRRLIIMRHSKADRQGVTGGDFDRPLTAQGRADAGLIAAALAQAGLEPDLVLVSAAVRTLQTWAEVAKTFPAARVIESRTLYNAEEHELRKAVADADDACDTLLLVAHNPGVHALAARLLIESAASPAIINRIDQGFPPSSAIAFAVDEGGRAHYDGLFLARELGGAGD